MTVTVELLGGSLPLAVALDEGLQRAHQLAAVGALAVLDRREDRVAEQAQRVVVLEREQQLEGTEVAVGREARAGAVAGIAERPRLQSAARLVERAPQLAGGDGPAHAGGELLARAGGHADADALGERELGVLVAPLAAARLREQRARERAGAGHEPAGRLVAHRIGERL